MNIPSNNPYQNSPPAQNSNPDNDKGSVVAGFFIGWGLMIGGSMLTGFAAAILSSFSGVLGTYNNPMFQLLGLGSFSMPIIIIIAAMILFGKKGKSKTVKGIAAAIISLIALALLLVAACFGIFAMGGGYH